MIPVRWNAAGTWDLLADPDFPYDRYIQKSVTVLPRAGDQWAWKRWGSGIVNRVGVVNPGVEAFERDVLPRLADQPIPFAVSILGLSLQDWQRLAHIDADLELNLACPNNVGTDIGADPVEARSVVRVVRCISQRKVAVKLPVHTTPEVALACEEAGADRLVMVNALKTPRGALSGPPLRSLAIEAVERAAAVVSIPITGVGGIASAADEQAFLDAGATDIAIGTAHLLDRN